ncbi:FmdB family zinc ribbon protein [Amaricoccus sp.]|uniref:FmdB family zinc ribbon protein n=1 Tax=Amaricoccus sp. TaxID=1872485 RepID=UPI002613EFE3|nr:FmdB family zinc ribbon protein [Amaricoccus sp.]HRO11981.1 zinc ribbon domain-containing protein [Amaricoccus sp.]
MPLYDFVCGDCGPFRAWAVMAASEASADCPDCGAGCSRAVSAPRVSTLNGSLRSALARSERSIDEPRVVKRKHLAGCGCSMCRPRANAVSSRWKIGH